MSWRTFRQAPAGMQFKCLSRRAGLLFLFAQLHFCVMDKQKIKERRERRQQFLRTLYEEVDGSVNEFVDGLDNEAVRALTPATLVVTPWRGVLIPEETS